MKGFISHPDAILLVVENIKIRRFYGTPFTNIKILGVVPEFYSEWWLGLIRSERSITG